MLRAARVVPQDMDRVQRAVLDSLGLTTAEVPAPADAEVDMCVQIVFYQS